MSYNLKILMDSIISIKGLSKTYNSGFEALKTVDLEINGGLWVLQFTLGHKRHQIRTPGAENPRNSL